ncbi:MAG: response regulator [Bacteroidetes bacterium]|nr:response regulator [Bacteroidota bacterium]
MKINKKLKIFIVDNSLFYLNLYEQNLKNIGHTDISTFVNGTDCIKALSEKPDIVFLDSNINNSQGSDLLKRIKLFNPGIFVVMVIDPEGIRTTINSTNVGIADYIIKGQDEIEKANLILLKLEDRKSTYKKNAKDLCGLISKNRKILP